MARRVFVMKGSHAAIRDATGVSLSSVGRVKRRETYKQETEGLVPRR
jgi:uncharacterized protein YerC